MKIMISALVLIYGFAFHSVAQAESISTCLGKLEAGAKMLSFAPSYKADVLKNMDFYQTLAVRAMQNAKAKRSNDQVMKTVQEELQKNREASSIGEYTANCLAPMLAFQGSSERQYKLANIAFQKIDAARKQISE